MVPGILQIVIRSVSFYKKQVIYQLLILALLTAVITGSLLTGVSVRNSLKKASSERLGNTRFLISSGVRYFSPDLASRIKNNIGINVTGLLEINGLCQGLTSQKISNNVHIFGIAPDFFEFHKNDSSKLRSGEVAVNSRLADYLDIKPGDEVIIRFKKLSDIPADAPFAAASEAGTSLVMKVGAIIDESMAGNFSLSISQIMPMNIFISLTDLSGITGEGIRNNRLLIEDRNGYSPELINAKLKELLQLSDVGFTLRKIKSTGGYELISDRVFIDQPVIDEIQGIVPSSAPVITYLGNSIRFGSLSAPYSFVTALPESIYPGIPGNNEILINRWLANDLAASEGDTIEIYWYSPDSLRNLIENNRKFIIKGITEMHSTWSDSLLMPDFPGIAGSESCSDWDAGVPIRLTEIREKDEDYWNKYKGTPKAFINYNKGKEIWGNNYGPATSLRFPTGITGQSISNKLSGSLSPDLLGFTVSDIARESLIAAEESIDFSTLFLSLGFFLIFSSLVLLSLAVSNYLETKKGHINTYFALGFKVRWIRRLLLFESSAIAFVGCFWGAIAGYLVNTVIISALNTVWKGAVQTDTLKVYFNVTPLMTGFLVSFLISVLVLLIKLRNYLLTLNRKEKENINNHLPGRSLLFLLISIFIFISLFVLSFFLAEFSTILSFAAGTILMITLLQFWRYYYIRPDSRKTLNITASKSSSQHYYSFYPSHAIAPILFISAGIFAVFITGANRMSFEKEYPNRSGGTGGYLLWCENAIPIKEDIDSPSGRKSLGLDDNLLNGMRFIQIKRSTGDDASCLNLNHVKAPPLLGIDPGDFIVKGAFSFIREIEHIGIENSWLLLNNESLNNIIYGIADQTVLQWGLKIQTGDTIILRAENGQPLKIIIAAGLKSSVFQGFVLIGNENFRKYFPSISGSSVMLVDGDPMMTDTYKKFLNERLNGFGISIENTTDRLASFYEVTNTYLSVFGVFGALGMITGIAGLGFVLLKNYNTRKREFALLLATGITIKKIRKMILREQILILFAGVSTGVFSAFIATIPSINGNAGIPWLFMVSMILAIVATGIVSLYYSVKTITSISLKASLKETDFNSSQRL